MESNMAKKKTVGSCSLVAPTHRRRGRGAILAGLCTLACVVRSSSFAAADELSPQNQTVSLGLVGGVFLPDRDVHDFYYDTNTWQPLNSAAPVMGLRASYEPVPYGGIEVEGEMAPIGIASNDDRATILGFRAQLIGQFPARLTPFLLAGVGAMGIVSGDSVLGDDTDLVWHTGAGAKFFITSSWSVRVDGRWLIAPKLEVANEYDTMVSHFLVTTSLSWRFGGGARIVDTDQDTFIGSADRCPLDAGVAPDGCPALADIDQDGILDRDDKCPSEAEVLNEVDDQDGCPDKDPDGDADGIADNTDKCRDVAEDMDGFEDSDGCPETDNDKDGLVDAQDGCAQDAGPIDNHGCPDKDGDGDGLADRFDNCPAESGSQQNRGCKTAQLIVITLTDIKVMENIYFATGKAKIRARSNALLDNLAQVLTAHPEITHVSVEGHTDDRGDQFRNQGLSFNRARAVVEYLAVRGVSADRLKATGVGEERPIANNRSSSGRSLNRRVEFMIERKVVVAAP